MSAIEKEDIELCGWTLNVDGKEVGKELGSGHFAKVRLAQRKSDGLKAACKIIKKPKGVPPSESLRARIRRRSDATGLLRQLTVTCRCHRATSAPLLQIKRSPRWWERNTRS